MNFQSSEKICGRILIEEEICGIMRQNAILRKYAGKCGPGIFQSRENTHGRFLPEMGKIRRNYAENVKNAENAGKMHEYTRMNDAETCGKIEALGKG